MTNRYISSVHVEKLGHKIQEIRERALLNIVSKLEHGFVYDNDLARSREILSKLFEWFQFEPRTYQNVVLDLIARILRSESGTILVNHYGPKAIITEIRQIRSFVKPNLYPTVDELLDYIQEPKEVQEDLPPVPPLQSDVPLSYRTQDADLVSACTYTIGSTATPIEGLIQRDSSLEQQTGLRHKTPESDSAKCGSGDSRSVGRSRTDGAPLLNFNLKWQPLIASDRHVLESVEESMRNPTEPATLLHSCEFFVDVMLQDFPAEIFLQRPAIISLFHHYLKSSTSTRLSNAILNCLLKMTKSVITRISYYRDPSTCNSKNCLPPQECSGFTSPVFMLPPNTERPYMQNFNPQLNSNLDEDVALLLTKQLSLPKYCFMSMLCVFDYICVKPESLQGSKTRRKSNQTGINLSLTLLDELINLLKLCLKPGAWYQEASPAVYEILRKFEEVLLKLGDVLDHFSDCNQSDRAVHLRLLCSSTNLLIKLIPLSKADVLPRNLKNVLASTLLDSALARLYPSIHENIFQFVKKFGGRFETDSITKYSEVKSICNSIDAAIKLLRDCKSIPVATAIELAREGVLSLEFHRNLTYVSIVVDLCANKLPTQRPMDDVFETAERLVLLLLSHGNTEVQEEMYKLCCKKVTAAIGPKLNTSGTGAPGSQILFLLRAPILTEICLHGITNDNMQVQKDAYDILIHILKCKILISEEIWTHVVQALIPVLPMLICYAGKSSGLGRTVIDMLDPDSAKTLYIPLLEVIKGNLCLLFVDDALTREEAISRLCWMLSSQDNSRDLLPRLNSLQDKSLGSICRLQRKIDVNKVRPTQHFYQPEALNQVLDLLNSEGVEPVIRRSALTQVSVMLEDPLLHYTFVESKGIRTVLNIMKSSLTESDYNDYVDCVIPAVCVLKNLCLYNASSRHELCRNLDTYYYILRGLFMFCSEDHVRQDCSVLLCLLLFNDYMLGSPAKLDLSLPYLVVDKLCVPFNCNVHWRTSHYTLPNLAATIASDKWCLSSIQIQWNSEWFGSFREILNWDKVKYSEFDLSQFSEQLRLTNTDLLALKSSSLDYCISMCLTDVQNATSHNSVINAINKLECYLSLYTHTKDDVEVGKQDILTFPWEYSFSRFLNAVPANEEDTLLLTSVLKFLIILVPVYTEEDKPCWLLKILKNSHHCLPNLLQTDTSPELELKTLHQVLLNLITVCVWHEQQFFDLHSPKSNESSDTWLHVIEIIADNLKFTDSQHFYNLAYLDCVLSCLVHLTTAFGWSRCKAGHTPKEPIPGMILGLCELVGAFHCGKGLSAAESVMGLNITRHVLLVLNHLLAEMQCFCVKGWELCFIGENAMEENILYTLCALWISRDVVLRAAVLQLLAGLAMSARASIELVQDIKDTKTEKGIWEMAMTILLDHDEASIVRENAACLLGNLVSHTMCSPSNNLIMIANLTPSSNKKGNNAVNTVLNLLDDYKFYKELEQILTNLYIEVLYYFDSDNNQMKTIPEDTAIYQNIKSKGECAFAYTRNLIPDSATTPSTVGDNTTSAMIVTPSLIKNIAIFVNNLLILAEEEVTDALQEYGLIKMFFRALSNPPADINNTKDLALYCDILEMNTAVCALLNKAVSNNQMCLGTILHTRDCLNVMLSLLNPSLYFVNLSQLVYLRNRLWTKVFGLIGSLLDGSLHKSKSETTRGNVHIGEAFTVVSTALGECGHQPFLQTLCEAISSNSSIGHKIQEIRERALLNIVSKLEHGFVYDNDLARSREILSKLFEWFQFEPRTYQNVVLDLIARILRSESGTILVNHYGPKAIITEIRQIRSFVKPNLYPTVDELLDYIQEPKEVQEDLPPVPPLQSDVPLSYRTQDADLVSACTYTIGSTATPIEGLIQRDSSLEQQTGLRHKTPETDSAKCGSGDSRSVGRSRTDGAPLLNFNLKWQPLIASDRHVLESVEESMRNPTEPATLLHSCEFFVDVMLQDFPAEIFLQRPAIISLFHHYLKSSTSTRLSNAILNCLLKMTKSVITRISYYRDPSTCNSKNCLPPQECSGFTSPVFMLPPNTERPYMQNFNPQLNSNLDEDVALLLTKQLSLPKYCFMSMLCVFDYICVKPESLQGSKTRRKSNQTGINLSLTLLDELINLLKLCLKPGAWYQEASPAVYEILRKFEEVLLKLGDVLDHFRLEVMSSDCNQSDRAVHLRLLCSSTNLLIKLIPLSKADVVLPRNLKNVLASTLLDSALTRLYPSIHENIFQFVKKFGGRFETDSITKYSEVKSICNSIDAAIKLLRDCKSTPVATAIELAREGVLSLEFHRNLTYVSIVVDLCANKLPTQRPMDDVFETAERLVLLLLSHGNTEVQEEMYKLCCKKVTAAIGPKLNTSGTGAPGSQILFLLRAPILTEICLHGITNDNMQVQKDAYDILIHILKCKILVSEEIWTHVVQALIPVLPMLICYAGKSSGLGRTVIGMLDPDSAKTLYIPLLEVIKGNLCLLFVDDALTREEAISRLCWMLSSQDNSRDLLPRLNTLQDKSLGSICRLQRKIDVNKVRPTQHFYQPEALNQVLDLLNSEGVEPVIRRSALTQVSVMLEDPLLHYTFVESKGIRTVLNIMKSSLTESDYNDYVDCVIPAVCVLKNLCLYNASSRHELCHNLDTYYYILRGLFMFCSEDRVRQDCSVLLCLLLFNDYMLGSPAKLDLSLPYLVVDKLCVPFNCNVHWRTSHYTLPNLAATIASDKWCLSSIQIQWNSEWFGSFREILNWDKVKYSEFDLSQFSKQLRLTNTDLLALKSSSLDYCISMCLTDVQNATSHNSVINAINKLECYLSLYTHTKDDVEVGKKDILTFPWEYSFSRFLNAVPANEEDTLLLTSVLKFLIILVPVYTEEDKPCWLLKILKNSHHCLPNLLQTDTSPELELKTLHQVLLNLITVCVWHEQQFFDLHSPKSNESSDTWLHVIEIIADNLKFTDSQHFYNLAYLDCVLSCLVHLTTAFGWSRCKAGHTPKEPIPGMILGLCELVGAFHCGKGLSAAESVMGLNITRHVLLVLNHLLAEMQCFCVKGWELCFIGENAMEENILYTLCALWISRDVVLRAAVLQLLAGLAMSARASIELVQDIKDTKTEKGIWEMAMTILLDHDEASIVRENAACLLGNLVSHTMCSPSNNLIMIANLTPSSNKKGNNAVNTVLNLLDDYKFYKELEQILTNLYIEVLYYFDSDNNQMKTIPEDTAIYQNIKSKGECAFAYTRNLIPDSATTPSTVGDNTTSAMIVTPSLIKNIAIFVNNLLILAEEEVTDALQEYGLIKMFFRALSNPPADINNTKDLALYCDILEMNTAVCALLNKAVSNNQMCLGTILHTRDCLNVMLSLLNPSLYFVNLSQLVYLRNRLWTKVFGLIGSLLDSSLHKSKSETTRGNVHIGEAFTVVSTALGECGYQPFLQTLCEAISSNSSIDLQQSALTSLTSLLRLESKASVDDFKVQETIPTPSSIRNLLDNTKTPRTPSVEENLNENIENIEPELDDKELKVIWARKPYKKPIKQDIKVLENAYFGKVPSKLNELNKKKEKTDMDMHLDLTEHQQLMAGAELCRILLHLYDVCNVKDKNSKQGKKKVVVVNTLTSILCVSSEAKKLALQTGLMDMIVEQFKEIHLRLSLESVEYMRRIGDKKRICPVLKELNSIVGLVTNFMLGEESIKCAASVLGLADLVHKLWIWFCAERSLLTDALKMLCTFTTDCYVACQSLPLTSSVAGAGPRKIPSNLSLLHEIITVIGKEMDFVSRTHELEILELAFHILHNICIAVECRNILTKTNLFQSLSRLHPAITKRQKPWENVELIWLDFLLTFTAYPEGQAYVAKSGDALEFVMMLTSSTKMNNRKLAVLVLRNIAFFQPNRPRLLNSDDFLRILQTKLTNGATEEKNVVATIMWALVANNQRAKLVLKCAGLDARLQESLKHMILAPDESVNSESINMMTMVLSILRDGERVK